MMIVIFFLLLFAGSIRTGIIPTFNASILVEGLNETDTSPPLVIYNSNNETTNNSNHSSIDQNQFAETVVDLVLDLLEKANLSRTVSVIHNETELTALVEEDDSKTTATTKVP